MLWNWNRLEVTLLLIVYIGYGYTEGGSFSYVLLTLSSCFLVVSWLFVSYIFNPSSFEWQKFASSYFIFFFQIHESILLDFDDWYVMWIELWNILMIGLIGLCIKVGSELGILVRWRTIRGRVLETILCLRFFIFQYRIVYKLHLTRNNTSLSVFTTFIDFTLFSTWKYTNKKYITWHDMLVE